MKKSPNPDADNSWLLNVNFLRNSIMEAVENQSPTMERRKIYLCIYIESVVISWVRLVCMVALIIMYSVMINMGWTQQYLDFVAKYTFKDFDKYTPNEFASFYCCTIFTRTILCVTLLLGIHLKEPSFMVISMISEMLIFISLTIFYVTFVSIYNLVMDNWVLGISQLLIGYTYIMYLFISSYILFRCMFEIARATHT